MHIKKAIAKDIAIPESIINTAISSSRSHVKIFHIKKNNGGFRKIYHPSKKLKTIQYWLIHSVFSHMPIHESAMAYREGISILHNAVIHRNNRFFLKMDFKNFFPCIQFSDLLPVLRAWHDKSQPEWSMTKETEDFIRQTCFYLDDKLVIGYPSSPIISNIVMTKFDAEVTGLISDKKYGNAIYTRYSDDLVLSTDKKGACRELKIEIEKLVNMTKSPNITINSSKTKIGSSSGGSAAVTGLKICKDGHITIHRKQKDHIRLMLSLYSRGKLRENEELSLIGHLAYCHYVAPQFYTNLSQKYFQEIHVLREKNL